MIYVGHGGGVSVCDATLTTCVFKSGPTGTLGAVDVSGITLYKDTLYIGCDNNSMFLCDIDLTACTTTDGGGTFAEPSKLIVVSGV